MSSTPSRRSEPRKVLNLPWLLGTVAVCALLGGAAYFWHGYQLQRLKGSLLVRADQLERDRKWSEAAGYLYRYLQIDPDALAIRIRLAQVYDRSAEGAERKSRAVEFYYRAIGLAPEESALRSRLAELLLELGRFAEARQQASTVLQRVPQDPVCLAVRALAAYALSRSGAVSKQDALAEVRAAAAAAAG